MGMDPTRFRSNAGVTAVDIACDELASAREVKKAADALNRLVNSWVACRGVIVAGLEDLESEWGVVGDVQATIPAEQPIFEGPARVLRVEVLRESEVL
jgi:hypothetical protein